MSSDREASARPETGPPLVTVIVPVRDDADGLHRCLTALLEQSYPQGRVEIIVVDDGSRRPVAPVVAAFPGVRIVVRAGGGSYAARNAGLAAARGRILAFTDADCTPRHDWIARGVAFLATHPDCGLVAGHVDVTTGDPPDIAERYEQVTAFRQEQYATVDRFAATANAWVRREVIEQVGGFDDRLASGGDAEFGMRVAAAGFDVCYAGDVRVAHPARSLRALIGKQRRVGAGLRDRHASQPPATRARVRMVTTRLLPWVAALRIARRQGAATDATTRLRLFALALAVRQLYLWSYLLHRPRPMEADRARSSDDAAPATGSPAGPGLSRDGSGSGPRAGEPPTPAI